MALLTDSTLDRINDQAREVRPREVLARLARFVLLVLASLLWAAGWSARWTVRGVWLAACWSIAAIRVGWAEAGTPKPPRRR